MALKLFVAGIPFGMDDNSLGDMFAGYGTVVSAKVVTDRETNRSKGFGFVEFSEEAAGDAAIAALNGKDLGGRPLTVNAARPREERPNYSQQNRQGSVGNNFRRGRR